MALRTQVDPYVLVGDLADLPNPADVAQGTLFHAEDTGDCRILVINPASQFRYWDPFCGTSAASGPPGGELMLKWSGTVPAEMETFLGDSGIASIPNFVLTGLNYVVPVACIAENFNIFVSSGSPAGVVVSIFKNGIVIVIMTVTLTGPQLHTVVPIPGSAKFNPGDTIDVLVNNVTNGNLVISVTGLLVT